MVVGGASPPGIRWVLAGAFLIAATSWGMTLRLEPFVALLAVACLAAMVSFMREPRITPLAVAMPAAVLATTAHPAGLVAASPVLASAPAVARWLSADGRSRVLALAALLGAAFALTLVVYTLDADLQSRLADGRLLREGEYFYEPWQEYIRYLDFDRRGRRDRNAPLQPRTAVAIGRSVAHRSATVAGETRSRSPRAALRSGFCCSRSFPASGRGISAR